MRCFRFAVTFGLAAAVATGCTADAADPTAGPSPTPMATSAAVPASPSMAAASAIPSPAAWKTGTTTVTHHPAVPPVPVVTAIRYASHAAEGYDRIVFDVPGQMPSYTVKYVAQVRADPSDRPVRVPGRRFLLVVFNPAQAHRTNGTATVSGTHTVNLPMLKAYAVVGDFEGHVSVALGLNSAAGYRVGELSGRIYLDVAT